MLVVSDVKSWGVQGYVSIPEAPRPAAAYYRLPYGKGALIGHAEFVHEDEAEDVEPRDG